MNALQTWVAGMKYLPPAADIPDCFKILGYAERPVTVEEVKTRYHKLAQAAHPDAGGDEQQFIILQNAYEEAIKILEEAMQK